MTKYDKELQSNTPEYREAMVPLEPKKKREDESVEAERRQDREDERGKHDETR